MKRAGAEGTAYTARHRTPCVKNSGGQWLTCAQRFNRSREEKNARNKRRNWFQRSNGRPQDGGTQHALAFGTTRVHGCAGRGEARKRRRTGKVIKKERNKKELRVTLRDRKSHRYFTPFPRPIFALSWFANSGSTNTMSDLWRNVDCLWFRVRAEQFAKYSDCGRLYVFLGSPWARSVVFNYELLTDTAVFFVPCNLIERGRAFEFPAVRGGQRPENSTVYLIHAYKPSLQGARNQAVENLLS